MGEMFNEWREMKREKKRANQSSSTDLLRERGVEFESHNNGVHLVVRSAGKVIDFWPSTGKFIVRGGKTGRGVFNLLRTVTPKGLVP